MPTTPTTAVEHLDAALSALNGSPCRFAARGEGRCLEPHPGEGPSWRDMNPGRMCAGCAAYWHASMAVDDARRAERIAAAEAEEVAGR